MEAERETVNVPVQLECVCSTRGDLMPRWFRFEDGAHQICTVRIESVLAHKGIEYVGIRMLQYICRARIGERLRVFELRYHVADHKWILFRMLDEPA